MTRIESTSNPYTGVIPATPAEAAANAVRWERRGILGRLVRIDEPVPAVELAATGRTRDLRVAA